MQRLITVHKCDRPATDQRHDMVCCNVHLSL